jgi:hypothetical protein
MISLIKVILSLDSTAQAVTRDEDIDTIEWTSTPIDKALITAEATRLEAEYDSQQYARDRQLEYPSIGDQLDMIFHSGLGGAEFQAAIQAVKNKFPKGG